jgi:hypothetical protein
MVAVASGIVEDGGATHEWLKDCSQNMRQLVGMPGRTQSYQRKTARKTWSWSLASKTRAWALAHVVYRPVMLSIRLGRGAGAGSTEAFVPMRFVPAMIKVLQQFLQQRHSNNHDKNLCGEQTAYNKILKLLCDSLAGKSEDSIQFFSRGGCWKSLLGPVEAELGNRKGIGILSMLRSVMIQVFSQVCPLYCTLPCSACTHAKLPGNLEGRHKITRPALLYFTLLGSVWTQVKLAVHLQVRHELEDEHPPGQELN